MDKLELGTPDLTDANIDVIARLFPQVVTEVADESGELRQTIDFEALRQELADDLADGPAERYQFTWPGKQAAKLEARRPVSKALRPARAESVDFDTTRNLYIEGDNLDALRLLRNNYAGQVKMIYIDPPYNTGNDFVYDDDYSRSATDYRDKSGDFDPEGGRLVQNLSSNGRFHSDWCSMMYPRLLLAKDLLTSDGAIFKSINDNESVQLRKICDEVFGEENFIAPFVWQSRQNRDNRNNSGVSTDHEYIVFYTRKPGNRIFYGVDRDEAQYTNPDNDSRGDWASANMVGLASAQARPNLHYDLVNPATGINYGCPEMGWRYDQSTIQRLIQDNRIIWPSEITGRPRRKVFLSELSTNLPGFSSIMDVECFTNTGTRELRDLLGAKVFDFPKPSLLIQTIIRQCTNLDSVVLDFFSGSTTTAQAVIQANADDGGDRRFILVQYPETTVSGSEASKTGYNTIADIGKERIRRAGTKIKEETGLLSENFDIGFRVLKIDSSNFEDRYATPSETTQQSLSLQAKNIKLDRSAEDILFEILPALRIPLSARIEELTINGKQIFNINVNQLLACFDTAIDTEVIEQIAKLKPKYAVFIDSVFAEDSAIANFEELFKTYSPDTECRVI
ncbi:MAG: site-specific DNA-methyltransferase [Coriobacteriia bacterium]|nr:site-specific DNA-methyltransferase [Coriobacteriia bacterium]